MDEVQLLHLEKDAAVKHAAELEVKGASLKAENAALLTKLNWYETTYLESKKKISALENELVIHTEFIRKAKERELFLRHKLEKAAAESLESERRLKKDLEIATLEVEACRRKINSLERERLDDTTLEAPLRDDQERLRLQAKISQLRDEVAFTRAKIGSQAQAPEKSPAIVPLQPAGALASEAEGPKSGTRPDEASKGATTSSLPGETQPSLPNAATSLGPAAGGLPGFSGTGRLATQEDSSALVYELLKQQQATQDAVDVSEERVSEGGSGDKKPPVEGTARSLARSLAEELDAAALASSPPLEPELIELDLTIDLPLLGGGGIFDGGDLTARLLGHPENTYVVATEDTHRRRALRRASNPPADDSAVEGGAGVRSSSAAEEPEASAWAPGERGDQTAIDDPESADKEGQGSKRDDASASDGSAGEAGDRDGDGEGETLGPRSKGKGGRRQAVPQLVFIPGLGLVRIGSEDDDEDDGEDLEASALDTDGVSSSSGEETTWFSVKGSGSATAAAGRDSENEQLQRKGDGEGGLIEGGQKERIRGSDGDALFADIVRQAAKGFDVSLRLSDVDNFSLRSSGSEFFGQAPVDLDAFDASLSPMCGEPGALGAVGFTSGVEREEQQEEGMTPTKECEKEHSAVWGSPADASQGAAGNDFLPASSSSSSSSSPVVMVKGTKGRGDLPRGKRSVASSDDDDVLLSDDTDEDLEEEEDAGLEQTGEEMGSAGLLLSRAGEHQNTRQRRGKSDGTDMVDLSNSASFSTADSESTSGDGSDNDSGAAEASSSISLSTLPRPAFNQADSQSIATKKLWGAAAPSSIPSPPPSSGSSSTIGSVGPSVGSGNLLNACIRGRGLSMAALKEEAERLSKSPNSSGLDSASSSSSPASSPPTSDSDEELALDETSETKTTVLEGSLNKGRSAAENFGEPNISGLHLAPHGLPMMGALRSRYGEVVASPDSPDLQRRRGEQFRDQLRSSLGFGLPQGFSDGAEAARVKLPNPLRNPINSKQSLDNALRRAAEERSWTQQRGSGGGTEIKLKDMQVGAPDDDDKYDDDAINYDDDVMLGEEWDDDNDEEAPFSQQEIQDDDELDELKPLESCEPVLLGPSYRRRRSNNGVLPVARGVMVGGKQAGGSAVPDLPKPLSQAEASTAASDGWSASSSEGVRISASSSLLRSLKGLAKAVLAAGQTGGAPTPTGFGRAVTCGMAPEQTIDDDMVTGAGSDDMDDLDVSELHETDAFAEEEEASEGSSGLGFPVRQSSDVVTRRDWPSRGANLGSDDDDDVLLQMPESEDLVGPSGEALKGERRQGTSSIAPPSRDATSFEYGCKRPSKGGRGVQSAAKLLELVDNLQTELNEKNTVVAGLRGELRKFSDLNLKLEGQLSEFRHESGHEEHSATTAKAEASHDQAPAIDLLSASSPEVEVAAQSRPAASAEEEGNKEAPSSGSLVTAPSPDALATPSGQTTVLRDARAAQSVAEQEGLEAAQRLSLYRDIFRAAESAGSSLSLLFAGNRRLPLPSSSFAFPGRSAAAAPVALKPPPAAAELSDACEVVDSFQEGQSLDSGREKVLLIKLKKLLVAGMEASWQVVENEEMRKTEAQHAAEKANRVKIFEAAKAVGAFNAPTKDNVAAVPYASVVSEESLPLSLASLSRRRQRSSSELGVTPVPGSLNSTLHRRSGRLETTFDATALVGRLEGLLPLPVPGYSETSSGGEVPLPGKADDSEAKISPRGKQRTRAGSLTASAGPQKVSSAGLLSRDGESAASVSASVSENNFGSRAGPAPTLPLNSGSQGSASVENLNFEEGTNQGEQASSAPKRESEARRSLEASMGLGEEQVQGSVQGSPSYERNVTAGASGKSKVSNSVVPVRPKKKLEAGEKAKTKGSGAPAPTRGDSGKKPRGASASSGTSALGGSKQTSSTNDPTKASADAESMGWKMERQMLTNTIAMLQAQLKELQQERQKRAEALSTGPTDPPSTSGSDADVSLETGTESALRGTAVGSPPAKAPVLTDQDSQAASDEEVPSVAAGGAAGGDVAGEENPQRRLSELAATKEVEELKAALTKAVSELEALRALIKTTSSSPGGGATPKQETPQASVTRDRDTAHRDASSREKAAVYPQSPSPAQVRDKVAHLVSLLSAKSTAIPAEHPWSFISVEEPGEVPERAQGRISSTEATEEHKDGLSLRSRRHAALSKARPPPSSPPPLLAQLEKTGGKLDPGRQYELEAQILLSELAAAYSFIAALQSNLEAAAGDIHASEKEAAVLQCRAEAAEAEFATTSQKLDDAHHQLKEALSLLEASTEELERLKSDYACSEKRLRTARENIEIHRQLCEAAVSELERLKSNSNSNCGSNGKGNGTADGLECSSFHEQQGTANNGGATQSSLEENDRQGAIATGLTEGEADQRHQAGEGGTTGVQNLSVLRHLVAEGLRRDRVEEERLDTAVVAGLRSKLDLCTARLALIHAEALRLRDIVVDTSVVISGEVDELGAEARGTEDAQEEGLTVADSDSATLSHRPLDASLHLEARRLVDSGSFNDDGIAEEDSELEGGSGSEVVVRKQARLASEDGGRVSGAWGQLHEFQDLRLDEIFENVLHEEFMGGSLSGVGTPTGVDDISGVGNITMRTAENEDLDDTDGPTNLISAAGICANDSESDLEQDDIVLIAAASVEDEGTGLVYDAVSAAGAGSVPCTGFSGRDLGSWPATEPADDAGASRDSTLVILRTIGDALVALREDFISFRRRNMGLEAELKLQADVVEASLAATVIAAAGEKAALLYETVAASLEKDKKKKRISVEDDEARSTVSSRVLFPEDRSTYNDDLRSLEREDAGSAASFAPASAAGTSDDDFKKSVEVTAQLAQLQEEHDEALAALDAQTGAVTRLLAEAKRAARHLEIFKGRAEAAEARVRQLEDKVAAAAKIVADLTEAQHRQKTADPSPESKADDEKDASMGYAGETLRTHTYVPFQRDDHILQRNRNSVDDVEQDNGAVSLDFVVESLSSVAAGLNMLFFGNKGQSSGGLAQTDHASARSSFSTQAPFFAHERGIASSTKLGEHTPTDAVTTLGAPSDDGGVKRILMDILTQLQGVSRAFEGEGWHRPSSASSAAVKNVAKSSAFFEANPPLSEPSETAPSSLSSQMTLDSGASCLLETLRQDSVSRDGGAVFEEPFSRESGIHLERKRDDQSHALGAEASSSSSASLNPALSESGLGQTAGLSLDYAPSEEGSRAWLSDDASGSIPGPGREDSETREEQRSRLEHILEEERLLNEKLLQTQDSGVIGVDSENSRNSSSVGRPPSVRYAASEEGNSVRDDNGDGAGSAYSNPSLVQAQEAERGACDSFDAPRRRYGDGDKGERESGDELEYDRFHQPCQARDSGSEEEEGEEEEEEDENYDDNADLFEGKNLQYTTYKHAPVSSVASVTSALANRSPRDSQTTSAGEPPSTGSQPVSSRFTARSPAGSSGITRPAGSVSVDSRPLGAGRGLPLDVFVTVSPRSGDRAEVRSYGACYPVARNPGDRVSSPHDGPARNCATKDVRNEDPPESGIHGSSNADHEAPSSPDSWSGSDRRNIIVDSDEYTPFKPRRNSEQEGSPGVGRRGKGSGSDSGSSSRASSCSPHSLLSSGRASVGASAPRGAYSLPGRPVAPASHSGVYRSVAWGRNADGDGEDFAFPAGDHRPDDRCAGIRRNIGSGSSDEDLSDNGSNGSSRRSGDGDRDNDDDHYPPAGGVEVTAFAPPSRRHDAFPDGDSDDDDGADRWRRREEEEEGDEEEEAKETFWPRLVEGSPRFPPLDSSPSNLASDLDPETISPSLSLVCSSNDVFVCGVSTMLQERRLVVAPGLNEARVPVEQQLFRKKVDELRFQIDLLQLHCRGGRGRPGDEDALQDAVGSPEQRPLLLCEAPSEITQESSLESRDTASSRLASYLAEEDSTDLFLKRIGDALLPAPGALSMSHENLIDTGLDPPPGPLRRPPNARRPVELDAEASGREPSLSSCTSLSSLTHPEVAAEDYSPPASPVRPRSQTRADANPSCPSGNRNLHTFWEPSRSVRLGPMSEHHDVVVHHNAVFRASQESLLPCFTDDGDGDRASVDDNTSEVDPDLEFVEGSAAEDRRDRFSSSTPPPTATRRDVAIQSGSPPRSGSSSSKQQASRPSLSSPLSEEEFGSARISFSYNVDSGSATSSHSDTRNHGQRHADTSSSDRAGLPARAAPRATVVAAATAAARKLLIPEAGESGPLSATYSARLFEVLRQGNPVASEAAEAELDAYVETIKSLLKQITEGDRMIRNLENKIEVLDEELTLHRAAKFNIARRGELGDPCSSADDSEDGNGGSDDSNDDHDDDAGEEDDEDTEDDEGDDDDGTDHMTYARDQKPLGAEEASEAAARPSSVRVRREAVDGAGAAVDAGTTIPSQLAEAVEQLRKKDEEALSLAVELAACKAELARLTADVSSLRSFPRPNVSASLSPLNAHRIADLLSEGPSAVLSASLLVGDDDQMMDSGLDGDSEGDGEGEGSEGSDSSGLDDEDEDGTAEDDDRNRSGNNPLVPSSPIAAPSSSGYAGVFVSYPEEPPLSKRSAQKGPLFSNRSSSSSSSCSEEVLGSGDDDDDDAALHGTNFVDGFGRPRQGRATQGRPKEMNQNISERFVSPEGPDGGRKRDLPRGGRGVKPGELAFDAVEEKSISGSETSRLGGSTPRRKGRGFNALAAAAAAAAEAAAVAVVVHALERDRENVAAVDGAEAKRWLAHVQQATGCLDQAMHRFTSAADQLLKLEPSDRVQNLLDEVRGLRLRKANGLTFEEDGGGLRNAAWDLGRKAEILAEVVDVLLDILAHAARPVEKAEFRERVQREPQNLRSSFPVDGTPVSKPRGPATHALAPSLASRSAARTPSPVGDDKSEEGSCSGGDVHPRTSGEYNTHRRPAERLRDPLGDDAFADSGSHSDAPVIESASASYLSPSVGASGLDAPSSPPVFSAEEEDLRGVPEEADLLLRPSVQSDGGGYAVPAQALLNECNEVLRDDVDERDSEGERTGGVDVDVAHIALQAAITGAQEADRVSSKDGRRSEGQDASDSASDVEERGTGAGEQLVDNGGSVYINVSSVRQHASEAYRFSKQVVGSVGEQDGDSEALEQRLRRLGESSGFGRTKTESGSSPSSAVSSSAPLPFSPHPHVDVAHLRELGARTPTTPATMLISLADLERPTPQRRLFASRQASSRQSAAELSSDVQNLLGLAGMKIIPSSPPGRMGTGDAGVVTPAATPQSLANLRHPSQMSASSPTKRRTADKESSLESKMSHDVVGSSWFGPHRVASTGGDPSSREGNIPAKFCSLANLMSPEKLAVAKEARSQSGNGSTKSDHVGSVPYSPSVHSREGLVSSNVNAYDGLRPQRLASASASVSLPEYVSPMHILRQLDELSSRQADISMQIQEATTTPTPSVGGEEEAVIGGGGDDRSLLPAVDHADNFLAPDPSVAVLSSISCASGEDKPALQRRRYSTASGGVGFRPVTSSSYQQQLQDRAPANAAPGGASVTPPPLSRAAEADPLFSRPVDILSSLHNLHAALNANEAAVAQVGSMAKELSSPSGAGAGQRPASAPPPLKTGSQSDEFTPHAAQSPQRPRQVTAWVSPRRGQPDAPSFVPPASFSSLRSYARQAEVLQVIQAQKRKRNAQQPNNDSNKNNPPMHASNLPSSNGEAGFSRTPGLKDQGNTAVVIPDASPSSQVPPGNSFSSAFPSRPSPPTAYGHQDPVGKLGKATRGNVAYPTGYDSAPQTTAAPYARASPAALALIQAASLSAKLAPALSSGPPGSVTHPGASTAASFELRPAPGGGSTQTAPGTAEVATRDPAAVFQQQRATVSYALPSTGALKEVPVKIPRSDEEINRLLDKLEARMSIMKARQQAGSASPLSSSIHRPPAVPSVAPSSAATTGFAGTATTTLGRDMSAAGGISTVGSRSGVALGTHSYGYPSGRAAGGIGFSGGSILDMGSSGPRSDRLGTGVNGSAANRAFPSSHQTVGSYGAASGSYSLGFFTPSTGAAAGRPTSASSAFQPSGASLSSSSSLSTRNQNQTPATNEAIPRWGSAVSSQLMRIDPMAPLSSASSTSFRKQ